MKAHSLFRVAGLSLALSACSTLHTTPALSQLDSQSTWVLLPSINNSETAQAGARLDSITASLLRVHGVQNLQTYPGSDTNKDALFQLADQRSQNEALVWAKTQGARYAVAASVDEWRYKVGLDGEPAAGITLSIIDVTSSKVVWTGSAASTGWSREAVSAVAQKTVDKLLNQALGH